MLVSKDLASSGNIRSVWNHHIDYFGACCWNIFFPRNSTSISAKTDIRNRSRFFYCLHGSFSADHDITFNLFVMRTKEIHHSIRTKKYQPPTNDNQLFESKNQAKKGTSNHFPTIFFPNQRLPPNRCRSQAVSPTESTTESTVGTVASPGHLAVDQNLLQKKTPGLLGVTINKGL